MMIGCHLVSVYFVHFLSLPFSFSYFGPAYAFSICKSCSMFIFIFVVVLRLPRICLYLFQFCNGLIEALVSLVSGFSYSDFVFTNASQTNKIWKTTFNNISRKTQWGVSKMFVHKAYITAPYYPNISNLFVHFGEFQCSNSMYVVFAKAKYNLSNGIDDVR